MPAISPLLVLAVTAGLTLAAVVAASLQRRRLEAGLRRVSQGTDYRPTEAGPDLERAATPHLPHLGAAAVRARHALAANGRIVFACDYTLGSVRSRRNLTRVLGGAWDGRRLSDVRVAPSDGPLTEQYARLMSG